MNEVPVVCVDGPAGVGKGTLAHKLAETMGWHYLDSGALYRLVALSALQSGRDETSTKKDLIDLVYALKIVSRDGRWWLNGDEVTSDIRDENVGALASRLACLKEIRAALIQKQRNCRQAPGLVADGRDMGSVIFPDALLKVFLNASAQARASRRYKQLKEKGIDANLMRLTEDLEQRDSMDAKRVIAPLRPAADAVKIDTTNMSVNEVFGKVYQLLQDRVNQECNRPGA